MNLGDPELEVIDPTPNVHMLFIHFDKIFFWTKLASRAVVRWSKRMYSCAGTCSYEGRAGFCDIALSEPLLKLRSRKDLIETLLHEMIHAFLFVTNRDQDRDGHGPNFKAHMHRINKSAGLNISIYHSFHDEVKLYQTHWWRCNGPCQTRRPYFGTVRRSMNKAPGPNDYWWNDHLKRCGGNFIKIKEPEKQKKSKGKKDTTTKPNADITKYITNNNIKTINNVANSSNSTKPTLKDSSNVKAGTKTKTNNSSTAVVSKKGEIIAPKPPLKPIPVFTGSGNTLNAGSKHYTVDVTETVRNVWANKQIATIKEPQKRLDPSLKKPINSKETGTSKEPAREVRVSNPKKHKIESTDLQSPPTKMKKIQDYFNATTILKDLYGDDYKLTQSNNNSKLVAVNVKSELVDCPICSSKFSSEEINRHLDECLNKDIIEKLSKDGVESVKETQPSHSEPDTHKPKLKEIIGVVPPIPAFKPIPSLPKMTDSNLIDLTDLDFDPSSTINSYKGKRKTESEATLQSETCLDEVVSLVDEIDEAIKASLRSKRRNTVGLITMNRGDHLPSIVEKEADEVQMKPGSSKEEVFGQICPCCGNKFDKPVEEHLDECLMFFDNNTTIPDEGASTSFSNNTSIRVEDEEDDIFDESQILNATGTKTPCPCCMKMVEQDDMNSHLDVCLFS